MRTLSKEELYKIYPSSDGKPMADNTLQWEWIALIKQGMDVVFKNRKDVFVAGDLFWYPVEGRSDLRVAPDVLIAIGYLNIKASTEWYNGNPDWKSLQRTSVLQVKSNY
ncbi:MAG: hypothetical protein SFV55_11825 [Haliscomenobacter sp.]|uniref:hypothetical protein n=1 Tax=Haliscomenobacter sp. TaxID=2717303 RepID=UPI0029A75ECA|nr:hypothetical protein [Haliscomenobacter sp.]MDX2069101.1 hypothetical protein [Haliscomenobacter sp.]